MTVQILIHHFETERWEEWVHELAELANEKHVEFSQGHSYFYNFCDDNIKDRETEDEFIRRSIIGASVLGIPWLVIHAGTDFDSATPVKKL